MMYQWYLTENRRVMREKAKELGDFSKILDQALEEFLNKDKQRADALANAEFAEFPNLTWDLKQIKAWCQGRNKNRDWKSLQEAKSKAEEIRHWAKEFGA